MTDTSVFTAEEAEKLSDEKIKTPGDLWARIGNDFADGIKQLSGKVNIEADRLIDILIDNADFERFERIERSEAQSLFCKNIRRIDALRRLIGKYPNIDVEQIVSGTSITQEKLIALATGLKDITPSDAKKLFDKGIKNADDLWFAIDREFHPGSGIFPKISADKLDSEEITELTTALQGLVLRTGASADQLISWLKKSKRSSYFSPEEFESLQNQKIRNADELWAALGKDFDEGIKNLADSINISAKRLTKLLIKQGKSDIESEKGPWFRQYWPDLTLIAGVAILALLALRAADIHVFPSSLRLNEKFVFTSRNMNKDQVIQANDLYTALLPSKDNYFKSKEEITGLILARPVAEHKPIKIEDVLRLQVVVLKDIPFGNLLTEGDITLKWTAYQKEAFTQTNLVVGRKASRAMRFDDVILSGFITEANKPSE